MATKKLVIHLVGRICLVSKGKGGNIIAVFLDARHNEDLKLEEHRPLLAVPLSMIDAQKIADRAVLTTVTFVRPTGETKDLVDALGVWSISGYDMTLSGVDAGSTGKVDIADVADLNAIVKSVDPKAQFEGGILGSNPKRHGVLARLKLPASANITAVTEDPTPKVFQPGGHTQKVATYVTVEVPFATDLIAPTLKLVSFKSGKAQSYKFDAQKYTEITLKMSNLCNCIKETKGDESATIDDPEFGLYYELVSKPGLKKRPLPQIPKVKAGIEVPVCYNPCRLEI